MSKVVLDVSMSLDGFVTGPNVREAEPMGDGGERLHEWIFWKRTAMARPLVGTDTARPAVTNRPRGVFGIRPIGPTTANATPDKGCLSGPPRAPC
jgi:hypothetical protein